MQRLLASRSPITASISAASQLRRPRDRRATAPIRPTTSHFAATDTAPATAPASIRTAPPHTAASGKPPTETSHASVNSTPRPIPNVTITGISRHVSTNARAIFSRSGGSKVRDASDSVAALRNRGHCELIENGRNGFLADQDDIRMLADHVLRLHRDEALRNRIAAQAQQDVCRYDTAHVLDQLAAIYRKYGA